MCGTCGCGEDDHITYKKPGDEASGHAHVHFHGPVAHSHFHQHDDKQLMLHHDHVHHTHDHDHDHLHAHDHIHTHAHGSESRTIDLQRNILSKNDLEASRNRGYFEALHVASFNFVSSPGSGKTSILERTIREKGKELNCHVIEGDQQTLNDARRIEKAGAPVIQINTGNGCHLDAVMVGKAVKQLSVPAHSTLFIENVGNLVCPALFDLGESKRVVIISVTEGEDKPAKYPTMFETAHLCLVNKTDLLPYLDFNMESFYATARKVNPHLQFIALSAKTGDGFHEWYQWLEAQKVAESA